MTDLEHLVCFAWARGHLLGSLQERDGTVDELDYQINVANRLSMNDGFVVVARRAIVGGKHLGKQHRI